MEVEIVSFEPGARKVSCTDLLRASAGLGLAEAHSVTTAATEGRLPRIEMPSRELAERLVADLGALGFVATVVAGRENGQ